MSPYLCALKMKEEYFFTIKDNMISKNEQTKQAYIRPAMKVANLEMEQSILAGSNQIESIGDTKEEIEWGNSRRGDGWGNLWD